MKITTDEDFEHTKSDEDNLRYFQKNKTFTISFSISVLLHIIVIFFIMYSNILCLGCQDTTQEKYHSMPKIKTYLLKHSSIKKVQEEDKELSKENVDEKTKSINQKPEKKNNAKLNDKIATEKSAQITAKSKKNTLNYTTLRSSINHVLEQDNQIIKNTLFDDCEAFKKKTGSLDCLSNIQRLGFKIDDPYNLSKYFKILEQNPDNKKKERLLSKLNSNKKYLTTVLNNKALSPSIREQFKEEIAYIRGEVHYQDCDGKPNSGTCAGEIDLLGGIGQLLGLLFSD